ncbi:glycoside hydrolase family 26 protein [Litoribaculum gwangyangense]|uniref:Mannan endo-1,4-beta-mannosidase n=1 Tax=Litoribaculum gwangyangense TaxID=1130722 RepID=A0ABP9CKQ5_9FLAO
MNFSCKPFYNETYKKPDLVDNNLSRSAKKLHKKLFFITKKGFAIGHQDATSYGIGWKHDDSFREPKSDIKELTDDYPAIFGFDIGHLELGKKHNLDTVYFNTITDLIVDAHKKGGLITISWHPDNPSSKGSSWDTSPAVIDIIGNGSHKEEYNLWIERVAEFIKSLKFKGKEIPILFRPFHEMNGNWFWWGNSSSNALEYIRLWRETVTLLRDKYNLHNLLYVYSPNKLNQIEDYMKYYPGDDYVDIFGIDIYDFNDTENYANSLVNDINLVRNIATEKNKLYGLTETGLDQINTDNWFTQVLFPNIENSGISWVLFWRNARKSHHYIPYVGHKNAEDFKRFSKLPQTLFLKEINQD